MQKLQHGQPVDPAERDRLLRLPITLPSNYLRTAVHQFQVWPLLAAIHCTAAVGCELGGQSLFAWRCALR